MNNILRLLYIFTLIVFPTNAFAYLDPGTGSIILQAILGFIAATIASVSIYWTKFKSLISKLFNKKKENKK
jgi:hypothetical protein|tara:strand:+ start:78 stop:290 length:213 start_codon:yes stop_codon:yes gene_type:complete